MAWQFYQDVEWYVGSDKNNHKQNTIDAGFPIREIFTTPQRQQPLKRLDADKIGFIFRKEMTLFEFYNALMDATEELNHD